MRDRWKRSIGETPTQLAPAGGRIALRPSDSPPSTDASNG